MAEPVFESAGADPSEGSGTNVVMPNPGGVVAGKLVVVYLFLDSAAQTITMPDATWFEVPQSPVNVTGGSHGLHVIWHRAAGSESGDYTFSWASSTFRTGKAIRYGNVVASGNPWDQPCGAAETNTEAQASPAVSTTSLGPDRLDCWASTNWSGGTQGAAWTPPTNYTERFEGHFGTITCADHSHPVAGSTGSVVGTCTGTDKRTAWIGSLIGTTAAGAGGLVVPRRPDRGLRMR